MSRILSIWVAGLAAGWLMLATPAASQAREYGCDYGGYQRSGYGYGWQGDYRYSGYRGGWGEYNRGPYGYGSYRRPAIVHPEYRHWTPGRGWHEHGHIHVPHRGHSHRYPY